MHVLITGAAGGVARLLLPGLGRKHKLRLLDLARLQDDPDADVRHASVTDLAAMTAACEGVDALIHLAGLGGEAPWQATLTTNINGTRTVLEAARRAGVSRVVLASSSHAVGFQPVTPSVPDYLYPRPDTYYGVSKVAAEALGSMYHDRYGIDIICVRIGSCFERPRSRRMLMTWLSPADCVRLLDAAISAPSPGFRIVWGVSANSDSPFSLSEARELGYDPQDNARRFAEEDLPDDDPGGRYIGGNFCSAAFDARQEPAPRVPESREQPSCCPPTNTTGDEPI